MQRVRAAAEGGDALATLVAHVDVVDPGAAGLVQLSADCGQQIAQAGLLATAGSYAELAQLKRQVALLEQRKALLALEADLGVAAPVATATAAAFDAADDDATLEP